MSEEAIEIKYRFVRPKSREIFEKFCAKIKDKELPKSWEDNPRWTALMLNIFEEIGRSFGYRIRKMGKGKEWMTIDETWEIRLPNISTIILALEHENTSKIWKLLDDELQKLLDVKAYIKVLVYYPLEPEKDIEEIKSKIQSQKIKLPDEKILVITGTYDIDVDPTSIYFQAYEFDVDGKNILIGKNKIPYSEKHAIKTSPS